MNLVRVNGLPPPWMIFYIAPIAFYHDHGFAFGDDDESVSKKISKHDPNFFPIKIAKRTITSERRN